MANQTRVVIALDGAHGKTLDVRGDLSLLRELFAALGQQTSKADMTVKDEPAIKANVSTGPADAHD